MDVTLVFAVKYLLTYHDTAKKHELIHTREKSNAWSEFVCEKKNQTINNFKNKWKEPFACSFCDSKKCNLFIKFFIGTYVLVLMYLPK